jgi:hypothetical protein
MFRLGNPTLEITNGLTDEGRTMIQEIVSAVWSKLPEGFRYEVITIITPPRAFIKNVMKNFLSLFFDSRK